MWNKTKHLMIPLVLILFISQHNQAKAQLSTILSIKGGINLSFVSDQYLNVRPGLIIGMSLYIPLGKTTHLVFMPQYIKMKAFMENKIFPGYDEHYITKLIHKNINLAIDYIEIPLVLMKKINIFTSCKSTFYIGPALSLPLSEKSTEFETIKIKNVEPVIYDPHYNILGLADGMNSSGTSIHIGAVLYKNLGGAEFGLNFEFIYPLYNIKNIRGVSFDEKVKIFNISFECPLL